MPGFNISSHRGRSRSFQWEIYAFRIGGWANQNCQRISLSSTLATLKLQRQFEPLVALRNRIAVCLERQ